LKLSITLIGLFLSGVALAGPQDAIPTCYDSKLPPRAQTLETELFVAIDQTTPLNGALRQMVADNVKTFLVPNSGFAVMTFSAFTQGHYMEVQVAGKLDPALSPTQRDDISKPALSKFDQCMTRQPQQAAQLIGNAMRTAFEGTSTEIAKSDVLTSMKAISTKVRESTARNKVVLIMSDMLENSSLSSFYADKGKSVRKIDPAKELQIAADNNALADFAGARVYVLGAGLLTDDVNKTKQYRDPKTMQALSTFWTSYFEKSKGKLVEFGQPALLNPVR
jgi:hypothetical protein